MLKKTKIQEYYKAFVEKDPQYDGLFFAAIKTTSIFCRTICPAKRAKFENCEFFLTAQEALLAGFRPCKRCRPLENPSSPSLIMKRLIEAVEADIGKRWKDEDVRAMGIDATTARRHFKQRFGLTFVAYARSRRMGLALQSIRSGEKVIAAQIDSGYESGSGFREAFHRMIGDAPKRYRGKIIKADWIETPIGPMIAMCDDDGLYLLEFTDRKGLEKEIERLRQTFKAVILPSKGDILSSIRKELKAYFAGLLKEFKTPVHLLGSEFQKSVLDELQRIPYGSTRSYAQQAKALKKAQAVRAVARANGQNQLAIIVPCHRVVGSDGKLTGYSGGLARKQWLLEHERANL